MENANINNDVNVIHDFLANAAKKFEARLLTACRQNDKPAALGALDELINVSQVKRLSEGVIAALSNEATVPTYLLSTLSIQEACDVLTRTADEDLRFSTGVVVAHKTYAITRLLQFELKRQSVIAAEGDQVAVNRLLIGLHNHDHKLFMTWHSHPGGGVSSITPSAIDLDFHRRLEIGNYPVIGVIVNRQGYVRFFSYRRPFRVSIYGKGMEAIDEQHCIFKLSKSGSIQI